MEVLFPPQTLNFNPLKKSVFLAGSIDMGKAQNWQDLLIESLQDWDGLILNPRRPDWDSSWTQEIQNPDFYQQVNWELDGLEKAGLIVYYFAPGSQAPITLMELGLFARSAKAIVCCPQGFWRKGNVDIVCERYRIPQVVDFESLKERVGMYFTN